LDTRIYPKILYKTKGFGENIKTLAMKFWQMPEIAPLKKITWIFALNKKINSYCAGKRGGQCSKPQRKNTVNLSLSIFQ